MIRKSLVNIRAYHEQAEAEQLVRPVAKTARSSDRKSHLLDKVGVYVPGGKAVYPSSVLMNVVPAKVAGVPHIHMTTPPGADGKIAASTLVAAKEAGVDTIYKVGGAQAIAALAFGTGIHSESRQDRWSRQYLCGIGKKGSVRSCQHRLYRRSE